MPQHPIAPPLPSAAAEPPAPEETSDILSGMIEEDDDETIAAAPDASAFAPRVHVQKPAHTAIYAKLYFRRTIIPILLTCGVMLPGISLWSMLDHNAPLAAIGTTVEVFLMVIGAILLALGVVNALHVKHILDATANSPKT